MSHTSWGALDASWIGKRVIVRWEDGSEPLADGLPSGLPHEVRGELMDDHDGLGFGVIHTSGASFCLPDHAHVVEITP